MEEESWFQSAKFWRRFVKAGLYITFIVVFWGEISQVLAFLWLALGTISGHFPALLFDGQVRQIITADVLAALTPEVGLSIALLLLIALFYLALFLLGVFWVAQLVLPIQDPRDRIPAFQRLFLYWVHSHGAAVFINAGQRIAQEGEAESFLPGVALVDLNSAIVIEQQQYSRGPDGYSGWSGPGSAAMGTGSRLGKRGSSIPGVRVAGPGLVFTKWGERICGEVDLRKQVRIASGIQGYTHDGISIKSNVFAVFTLGEKEELDYVTYVAEPDPQNIRLIKLDEKSDPNDPARRIKIISHFYKMDPEDSQEIHAAFLRGELKSDPSLTQDSAPAAKFGPPYYFDPERVSSAVYAQSYDAAGKDIKHWTDLPVKVATELFRNSIAQYAYDYLYTPEDEKTYPLKEFKAEFARSMRYQGVMSYKFVVGKHRPLEIGMEWDESSLLISPAKKLAASKLLRDYGIKVIHAGFSELQPEDEVRLKLLDNWMARWEKDIETIKAEHELKAMRIKNQARAQAQMDMASSLSSMFTSVANSPQAIALRLFQALETAATDPSTSQLLPKDVFNMLQNLHRWLYTERRRNADQDHDGGKNEAQPHRHE